MPTPRILSGPEAIAAGVRELAAGGLVVFPTETVYGLGADAHNAAAVARVFALKGRPANNPLIVHVSGTPMARRVVDAWPDEAERLVGSFWPGPLTLVLPRRSDLPDAVTAGGPTVGVRCPDHPVALALIEASGMPIVGPSANLSGRLSPTTADHAAAGFADHELLIIDGGACRAGIESTVLDLTGPTPRILRPGVIGAEAIASVLGRPVASPEPGYFSDADAPVASPGLLGAHYQPDTPVCLITDAGDAAVTASDALIAWSVNTHPGARRVFPIPTDPGGFAAALYARLHDADACGAERILVELPVRPGDPTTLGIYLAILERLGRASVV